MSAPAVARRRPHRAVRAESDPRGWAVLCSCEAVSYGDTPQEAMTCFHVHAETAVLIDALLAERFGAVA